MILKEGRRYRTRKGQVVGPLRPTPSDVLNARTYPWCWSTPEDRLMTWAPDGRWSTLAKQSGDDIVEEVELEVNEPKHIDQVRLADLRRGVSKIFDSYRIYP
jgi:hypothetical protein